MSEKIGLEALFGLEGWTSNLNRYLRDVETASRVTAGAGGTFSIGAAFDPGTVAEGGAAVQAVLDATAAATDRLANRLEELGNRLAVQGQRLNLYRDELAALAAAEETSADALVRKRIQLQSAEGAYTATQHRIAELQQTMLETARAAQVESEATARTAAAQEEARRSLVAWQRDLGTMGRVLDRYAASIDATPEKIRALRNETQQLIARILQQQAALGALNQQLTTTLASEDEGSAKVQKLRQQIENLNNSIAVHVTRLDQMHGKIEAVGVAHQRELAVEQRVQQVRQQSAQSYRNVETNVARIRNEIAAYVDSLGTVPPAVERTETAMNKLLDRLLAQERQMGLLQERLVRVADAYGADSIQARQLEARIEALNTAMGQNVGQLDDLQQKLRGAGDAANQTIRPLDRMGAFIANLAADLTARALDFFVDRLYDTARALLNFAKQGFEAVRFLESLNFSFQALVARELTAADSTLSMGDAFRNAGERAGELVQFVDRLAQQATITRQSVADTVQLAQAYGFTSEEAERLTQILVDFAAATLRTPEQVNRIALALGQIQAKGKLAGEEVRQLTEAGIPVVQTLARAFDITTAEVVRLQERGLIPATDAVGALLGALETDFGGTAARAATDTYTGLLNVLQNIVQIDLQKLFAGVFEEVRPLLQDLVELLQSREFQQSVRDFGEGLGSITEAFVALIRGTDWQQISENVENLTTLMIELTEASLRLSGEMEKFDAIRALDDEITSTQQAMQLTEDILERLLQVFVTMQTRGTIVPAQQEMLVRSFGPAVDALARSVKAYNDVAEEFGTRGQAMVLGQRLLLEFTHRLGIDLEITSQEMEVLTDSLHRSSDAYIETNRQLEEYQRNLEELKGQMRERVEDSEELADSLRDQASAYREIFREQLLRDPIQFDLFGRVEEVDLSNIFSIDELEAATDFLRDMNELEQERLDLQRETAEQATELNDQIVEANEDMNEDIAEAQADRNRELADLDYDYLKSLRDFRRDEAEIHEDLAEDVAEIHRELHEELEDLARDSADARIEYEQEVADAQQGFADDAAERATDLNERIEDINERFADRQEGIQDDIEDILGDLPENIRNRPDAERFLTIDAQKRLAELREELAEEAEERDEAIDEAREDAAREEEINRRKLANQLEDLRERYEAEEAERNRQLQEIQRDAAREEQIARDKHAEALDELRIRMADEQGEYRRRAAEIQRQSDEEIANIRQRNAEAVTDLRERIAEELAEYERENTEIARQQADLKTEYNRQVDLMIGKTDEWTEALHGLFEELYGVYWMAHLAGQQLNGLGDPHPIDLSLDPYYQGRSPSPFEENLQGALDLLEQMNKLTITPRIEPTALGMVNQPAMPSISNTTGGDISLQVIFAGDMQIRDQSDINSLAATVGDVVIGRLLRGQSDVLGAGSYQPQSVTTKVW